MLWADVGGRRVKASPGLVGLCPFQHEMHPKCGRIIRSHWAHENLAECDPWLQGETEWHLAWKDLFKSDWVERVIDRSGQRHIADVSTPSGNVIEFQHSPISPDEIDARCRFYGERLTWVFDIREAYDEGRFITHEQPYGHSFRWKHPKKSIWHAFDWDVEVLLDLGRGWLFELKKIYRETPCGGWGRFQTYRFLTERMSHLD